MFKLKFPRNQSFPGIADLWAVKALVWTTKPTGSPTPESRKRTQPKRVRAACLFYTEMCIFGHICPPISRKPEFSRHSGACGLRVPPFYCKTHQVASSRKSALGDDRPANYPPPLTAHVIVPNVRVKISEKPEFSRNSRPMGRGGTCMDYKTHWVSNSRKSKKYPAEEGTRGMPFSIRKCAFSVICVPLFLGKQSFPGIAVHVV